MWTSLNKERNIKISIQIFILIATIGFYKELLNIPRHQSWITPEVKQNIANFDSLKRWEYIKQDTNFNNLEKSNKKDVCLAILKFQIGSKENLEY